MKIDGSDASDKGKALEPQKQNFKSLINSEQIISRFREVMGEKTMSYLASVYNAWQRSPELKKCDDMSILSAAMQAATYDLPIDSNLGFAAIVPYNTKIKNKVMKNGKEVIEETWVSLAQFQIMYKGFIQLALRSGQYKTMNVSPIYEDELESYDIITGDVVINPVEDGFRANEVQEKICGYAAYFRLLNGFERLEYWSISRLKAHGKRFSKSFAKGYGLWVSDPHSMYAKTILKSTLSKWGILSITMQNAMTTDQAVVRDFNKPIDNTNITYIDKAIDPISGNAEIDPTIIASSAADAEAETSAEIVSAEMESIETDNAETVADDTQTEETNGATETKPVTEKTVADKPAKPKKDSKVFPKDEADYLEDMFEKEQAAKNRG